MIWVVGSKGMLGQEVLRALDTARLPYVGTDLDCDITDPSAIRTYGANREIRWIVNCSAYTAVDKAEREEPLAQKINAEGPANIGAFAGSIGARIIHISTDYVFDGTATSPYSEEALVNPTGAYGRTKAQGERTLAAACQRHFIVRSAWLYGARGNNFVYTMLRLMNERGKVGVVFDQRGTPTYAAHLAQALLAIIVADCDKYGCYHYTNSGETTWFGFAEEIYRMGRERGRIVRDCEIEPLRTQEYPTPAKRPAYSVLSKEKIISTFGIVPPSWQDGLEAFFSDLDSIDQEKR